MPHHRNTNFCQAPHNVDNGPASFELDGRGSTLLDQTACVADSLIRRHLVAEKRHVCHHKRAAGTATHRSGVVNHHVESDGYCGVITQHDHTHGIAHQEDVEPGAI